MKSSESEEFGEKLCEQHGEEKICWLKKDMRVTDDL